jgi:hypothetical protein
MKTKTFAWLILSDRLNTRDLLQRRHWHVSDDTHCVLCPLKCYEDMIHMFFNAISAVSIWNYLQINWNGNGDSDLHEVIADARRSFGHSFFMEVLITTC